jgi:hypothetical protein
MAIESTAKLLKAHIIFFLNSNRNVYSENNNVSQVHTYIPKIQKKIAKNATIIYRVILKVVQIF